MGCQVLRDVKTQPSFFGVSWEGSETGKKSGVGPCRKKDRRNPRGKKVGGRPNGVGRTLAKGRGHDRERGATGLRENKGRERTLLTRIG